MQTYLTTLLLCLLFSLTTSVSNALVIDNMEQVFAEVQTTSTTDFDVPVTTPGAVILGELNIALFDDFSVNGTTTSEGTGSGGYRFTGTSDINGIDLLYDGFASGSVDFTRDGADR